MTIVLFFITHLVVGVAVKILNLGEWGAAFWLIDGIVPTWMAILVTGLYAPNEGIGVIVSTIFSVLVGVMLVIGWFVLNIDISVLFTGLGIIIGSMLALFRAGEL